MAKEAALTSKALRQAALRLLPGDIQEEREQARAGNSGNAEEAGGASPRRGEEADHRRLR